MAVLNWDRVQVLALVLVPVLVQVRVLRVLVLLEEEDIQMHLMKVAAASRGQGVRYNLEDHYSCSEDSLLSSFGAAEDVEAAADNHEVLVVFVLWPLGVPCPLGVDQVVHRVVHHSNFLHKAVAVGPDSRMECYSDARSHRDTHYYYLGVRILLDLPFSCHNVPQGEADHLEDLHNKGVAPVA